MQREIKERVCDQCEKSVQQSEATYGGSPFHGWLSVKRISGRIQDRRSENEWDFCSTDCMLEKFKPANAEVSLDGEKL